MTRPEPQRVALVTGGGTRVGAAIVEGAAEAGYDVIVSYHRSERGAAEVASRVEALGRRCTLVQGNLADPDACTGLVETAARAHDRLDLVVNSAATFASAALEEVDTEAWDAVMAVNVRAPHLIVRAAAGPLRAAGGSVVNVVDLSAFEPWASYPHHSVSKAALAHLTRVQARALAPDVRVNAVAPGAVLPPPGMPEERWTRIAAAAPLGRPGAPQDVVEAVLWLARAPFVTGQVLAVDGGRSLGDVAAVEG